MEDQNKIDKYIAGLFEENPEVPAELAWENMDFDLPDHTKGSGNAKKRYLLLVLLLIIGLGSYFFWRVMSNAHIHNEQAGRSTVSSEVNNRADIESERAANKSLNEKLNSETDLQQRLNSSLDRLRVYDDQMLSNGIQSYSSNASVVTLSSASDEMYKRDLIGVEEGISADWTETPESSNGSQLAYSTIDAGELLPISIPGRDVQDIASASILSIVSVEEKEQKRRKAITLLLGSGVNALPLDVEEGNILQDKVSSARGRSYKLGLSYPLSERWQIQASLQYDRMRTIFTHSRDLDPVFDAVQGVRILREERTFHNNYTDLLGLQLGVDRIILILPSLDFTIGPVLAGNYLVNLMGKTTEGEETFPLSIEGSSNRFTISAGLRAGMQFTVNPRTHVGIGLKSQRFITRSVTLNDGVSTNWLHQLSVQLGYRF